MSDQFPFVVIPTGTSAHDLSQERPLLLKTITMIATWQRAGGHSIMAKEIIESLSMRMVIGAEKSFDLLQSLLVFAGWYVYQPLVPIDPNCQARVLKFYVALQVSYQHSYC